MGRINLVPIIISVLSVVSGLASGAQIPGVTPPSPPSLERQVEIFFGNDFLGRGGDIDDYRTQQLAVIAALGDRWSVLVEHSILTLEKPKQGVPGRLDQLAGSLSYRLIDTENSSRASVLEVGGGFRYSGELAGARIQNGFHQLINSSIKDMPYVDTDRVDATVWVRLDRNGTLKRDVSVPLLGSDWQFGYWGRAASLVTSDGQWDTNLGLMGVASKGGFQAWIGAQADWREGYDRDNVQRETAEFEDGAGLVLGFRYGPLIIETEQNFDNDSAYGHISLVSSGQRINNHEFGVQLGLTMPDVYVNAQGRWSLCEFMNCAGKFQKTALVDVLYGKPAFGSSVTHFVATTQLSLSMEFAARPVAGLSWFETYAAIGAGWRSERLEGEGELAAERSAAVDRFGLAGGAGLRFGASEPRDAWSFLLQIGVNGWLPTSSGTVVFAGQPETLQSPELALQFGALLRFF